VYDIVVGEEKKSVFCDMTTDQGGWTVKIIIYDIHVLRYLFKKYGYKLNCRKKNNLKKKKKEKIK
jgi:hypothetical protein